MDKKSIILSFFIGCVLFSTTQIICANSKKAPNILYIYANDLGKGMLSAYGQKHFSTPNIDALINNGVSFSHAYGGSVTAHARASLFTGYHSCHKDKWLIPRGGGFLREDTLQVRAYEELLNGNPLLQESDLYLPQIFQNEGYITAQIGMLGIGNVTSRKQMTRYGWDYYYGYLDLIRSKGYYPPFLFEDGKMVLIEGNTQTDCGRTYEYESEMAYKERWNMDGKKVYAPDLFVNKTIEFLHEFKDKPFFLMFSTPLPHGPVSVPAIHPEIANNEALTQVEKEYASMVKLLDDHVGKIMSELQTLGLDKNTIVIFTSDNGHEIHYQQEGRIIKPLRNIRTGEQFDNLHNKYYSDRGGDVFNGNAGMAGIKGSNLEGGIHIPVTFYWKGNLKNRICEETISNYDFLPTMADFLGIKLQSEKDGISYLPALMKGRKLPKDRYIIVASEEGPAIITNEKWKLRYHRGLKKYELYNLKNDPEEKYDVILRFPEKAGELEKILLDECNNRIENGIIY